MKNQKAILFLVLFLFIMAIIESRNIAPVSMMCLGFMMLSYLIEDKHLEKIARIIFASSTMIVGILYFIGKWNHGSNFDGSFNNIF